MNSRECVLKALQRQEPEWLPTFEWIINPQVIKAMTGLESEFEFIGQMELDGIAIGTDMKKQEVDSKHYKDEWGITRVTWDEYPNPVGHPVQTLEDLKKMNVPDPDADYRFDSITSAMRFFGGEKAIVIRLRDVFSQPRDLMGFENFLMAFYTDPELVDEIMRISVEYNTRLARNAKELGGEIIVTGDDIADNSGLLLSPEMYRAQVYPHYKQLVQNFKELGFLVIKHTDGNIMDVIDDLVATGIDCLDPIDPLAGMDIKQIKQQYGDSICIKGNVDCVETLVNKTEQDVIKATKKCILDASVGGGHIISSSNSIHASIDPQLYRTFLQTRKQYGQYPLDVETLSREVYDEK